MGKVAEHKVEAERIGSITDRIVQRLNPAGYIEFQLRQAVSDAVRDLGKERAMQIILEAAE
jgi:hypothetical protein